MTETERRVKHRREPLVEVGDIDPMSVYARMTRMELCRRLPGCTRAAGHDEDHGTKHVAAPAGIVEWVV